MPLLYDIVVYCGSDKIHTIYSLSYVQMLDVTAILYQLRVKYVVKENECDTT